MSIKFDRIRMNGQRRGTLEFTEHKCKWFTDKGHVDTISWKDTPLKKGVWTPMYQLWELKFVFEEEKRLPVRFSGFLSDDVQRLKTYVTKVLKKPFKQQDRCPYGQNWGAFRLKDKEVQFMTEDGKKQILSLPMEFMDKSVVNGENEISVQMKMRGATGAELGEVRLYIPPHKDASANPEPKYLKFQNMLTEMAGFDVEEGDAIATLEMVSFRTPRGKFKLDFYPDQLRLKSDLLKNSIKYDAIKKCFLFQQPHGKTAIVISVDPPIRQGQTTYNFLLCEFDQDQEETISINATDAELENEYADRSGNRLLDSSVTAKMSDILISLFSCLAKTKTISHSHKTFQSTEGYPCVRCVLKANQGYIYPLAKSFFFIHKPPTFIRYSEIQYVQFTKIGESSSIRNFDLVIKTQKTEHKFMNIPLNEFEALFEFLAKKEGKLRIANKAKLQQWVTDERESGVRKSRRIQEDLNLRTLNLKDSEDDDEDHSDDDFDEGDDEAMAMLEEDEVDDDNYDSAGDADIDPELLGKLEEELNDSDNEAIDFPKKRKNKHKDGESKRQRTE